ncbi:sulfurtransferase TusD [Erwinia sp. OLTSP20]|uniref:sulfurtransferase complex subunit TusD n=1 Tax=unclassified Erwinia TaxID=2622719 RepID=UPI000C19316B|nr:MULTISPECIES: sulfurtransferase complex subunit TusD [unclassified Erwinia]PIJ51230.1 sulfurtransferase TusD [Erwinia sp. OAMSP11]PIJ73983.1 sulfurtransferase TusD [Erwinia sp. OLSSP12]PIJ83991.1 sulfurtransferase TusD [Erwinia sp. OLCASP19]PIJ86521.1 sulfurtransferase TusD [Erwinia sp. OLMTSP26]PIJ88000.1 sulfurtransferase TusD [Erwinia sp. OLMDSP33]
MRFSLMVTGPAYGTQQSISALQFARALCASEHQLVSIFFYREGVYNANRLTAPAADEQHMVQAWQEIHQRYNVALNICVAAGLRRGVVNAAEGKEAGVEGENLADGFVLSGLGTLAQAALNCDRVVQF